MSYNESNMPSTYDSNVADSSQTGGRADTSFVKSLKGILRIVEMGVSLIAFICTAVGRRGKQGAAAWCMFVSMFSFLIFLITFFLWLFRVLSNVRFPIRFTEFIFYSVFSGLYFISAIIAAVFGNRHSGLAAGAFFLFVMVALCATDAFFHYRYWYSSDEGPMICGKGGSSSGGTSQGPPASAAPPAQDSRGPTY